MSEAVENWNPNTMGPDDWCGDCDWCGCEHRLWLDRPESDTWVCLNCDHEGTGTR